MLRIIREDLEKAEGMTYGRALRIMELGRGLRLKELEELIRWNIGMTIIELIWEGKIEFGGGRVRLWEKGQDWIYKEGDIMHALEYAFDKTGRG